MPPAEKRLCGKRQLTVPRKGRRRAVAKEKKHVFHGKKAVYVA